MKEKDFDFDKVGKKMPYKVDDRFFEDVTQRLLEQAKKEKKNELHTLVPSSNIRRYRWLYGGSSIAALLLLAFLLKVMYRADSPDIPVSETRIERSVSELKKGFPVLADSQIPRLAGSSYIEDIPIAETEPVSEITLAADSLIQNISDEELSLLAEMIGVNTCGYENYIE